MQYVVVSIDRFDWCICQVFLHRIVTQPITHCVRKFELVSGNSHEGRVIVPLSQQSFYKRSERGVIILNNHVVQNNMADDTQAIANGLYICC